MRGPLSPQAADLVRRIARVFPDEPGGLMAGIHAAVSAAADEPLRSEPVLAAKVATSTVTARILTARRLAPYLRIASADQPVPNPGRAGSI